MEKTVFLVYGSYENRYHGTILHEDSMKLFYSLVEAEAYAKECEVEFGEYGYYFEIKPM